MIDNTPLNADDYEAMLSGNPRSKPNPDGYAALLNPIPPRGPVTNSRFIGQSAMVLGSPYELDTLNAAANAEDTWAFLKQSSDQHYHERMGDVQRRVQEAIAASPAVLNSVIEAEQGEVDRIQTDSQSPVAPEKAYATNAALNGESSIVEQAAFRVALANELTAATEDRGWWDTAADVVGFLVPFGEAKDISDIPDAVKKNPQLAQIAGDDLESIVGAWKGMPVDRQLELLPHLKDAIMEATQTLGITEGNALKTVGILQSFFEVEGADALREQQAVDVALGITDVTPIGAIKAMKPVQKLQAAGVLRTAAQKVVADAGAAKVASEAGDVVSAGKHTTAAMLDEPTAQALGTTKADAAMSALPLDTKEWFEAVVKDDALPSEVASNMNDIAVKGSQYARSLTDESDLLQIGVLNGSERNQVIQSFYEHMERKGEDFLTQNLEMDNLTIVKQDERGFTYRFTLKDKNNPVTPDGKEKLKVRTGEVKFSVSDVTGDFSATVNDPIAQQGSKIVSPTTWAARTDAGDFNLEVKRALQSDDLATAYTRKAGELLDWAIEPVNGALQGKARKRIDAVLEAGDEYINAETQVHGRTFTPTELAAGIETKSGTVRLTAPDEVESYYRFRMYADSTYKAENFVLRRELELAGFKDIKLYSLSTPQGDAATVKNVRNASRTVGRPFDNVQSALSSVRGRQGQGIWDDRLGQTVDITDDYIRKAYEEGDVIVRLKKDWNTKGTGELDASGEFVQYARVKGDRVSDLPTQVLNYKAGYVPKINEAKFVISQRVPMIARGRPNLLRTQAMRAFDSLEDAKAFREEAITKFMNKNNVGRNEAEAMFPEPDTLQDLPLASRLEEAVGSHGGLYHANRSKDELLFGLSGQEMSRVSPLEAFSRHANHIGSFVAENEVRIAREKRWLNTVRRTFPDLQVKGFGDTALPTNSAQSRALETMREQITQWNGIPSREESLFQAQLQRVHDWALNGARRMGYADKESVKSLQWLMHKNPANAIKSAVMHNLLGFFNPAQLYMQASSLLIALSKHGTQGVFASKNVPFMAMLDNIRNPVGNKNSLAWMRSKGLLNAEDEAMYSAWQRTGLREAVYNNSDMANITGTGYGLTNRIMRNADFLSLYMYRAGELTARRFTFATEFGDWMRRTGKTKPTDAELSGILEEVHKDMLELGPANKAWWQGGQGTGAFRQMLSVATQFQQVGAKTLELILKGEGRGGFTNAQKARIVLSQAALFGAAGVPLGGMMAQLVTKGLGITEVSEEVAEGINQGFVGLTLNTMLDSEVEWSDRVALGAQMTQMVEDFITADDPLWVKAFGPSGAGVFGRVNDAFKELGLLSQADWSGHQELDDSALKLGLSVLAQIPSTGRNWWKWRMMSQYNTILDRRKNVIHSENFDMYTEAAALLGFQPSSEFDARILAMDNRAVDEQIQEYAQVRVALLHKAVYEMKLDRNAILAVQAALQMVDETTDPYIVMKGQEAFLRRMYEDQGDTKLDQELAKFLKRTAPEKLTEDLILDSSAPLSTSGKPLYQPFKQLLDGPQEDE